MFSFFALALFALGAHSITNTKVLREYDVKGNVLFARYTISFTAEEEDTVRDSYLFPLEFAMEHLSTISFSIAGKELRAVYDESANAFKVPLPAPLKNEEPCTLDVRAIFFDIARPLPAQIKQDEAQSIRLDGNLQMNSSYPSEIDELYILTHSPSYIASSPELTFRMDLEMYYSRNSDVAPGEVKKFYLQYGTPAYFLELPVNEREVILSHIAPSRVQEHVTARNSGAKFVGELNAFKNLVTRDDRSGIIREMSFAVPNTATDFAYRDDIGNISTSILGTSPEATRVTVQPRFPLYGGWKIAFFLEYFLPFKTFTTAAERFASSFLRAYRSDEFFYSDNEVEQKQRKVLEPRAYHVAIPLAPSMMHAATKEAVLRLALPEGARDLVISAPIDCVTKDVDEPITKSVMDYLGRRTIIIRRKNMINSPAFQDVLVQYNLPTLYLVHKPLILIGIVAFLVACVVCTYAFVSWFRRGPLEKPLPAGSFVPDHDLPQGKKDD